eukprot:scaffold7832_cov267-Pinguiococcus_pyrenoidosus.AAC.6
MLESKGLAGFPTLTAAQRFVAAGFPSAADLRPSESATNASPRESHHVGSTSHETKALCQNGRSSGHRT